MGGVEDYCSKEDKETFFCCKGKKALFRKCGYKEIGGEILVDEGSFSLIVLFCFFVNHVGIGSDYDGVGDSLPEGLKDVSDFPNLVQGLLARGYSEKDVKKILSENFLRVWSQVEAFAAKQA